MGAYVGEGLWVDANGERPDVGKAALELDTVRHRGERKDTRAPSTPDASYHKASKYG